MKEEPDDTQSNLSETMVARIEIEELGDPARERKITDAMVNLDGVIEAKIENGALHVSYDPLVPQLKRKSSRLSVLREILSRPLPQIQKLRIQICRHRRK